MSWQSLLEGRAARQALHNLRQGSTQAGVVRLFKEMFPDESDRDIREAARRVYDSFQTAKQFTAGKWDSPIKPTDAPWLVGQGVRPQDSPDCRYRYDVTVQYLESKPTEDNPRATEERWIDIRQIDSEKNLTLRELRALAEKTVDEWRGDRPTLPGGSESPPAKMGRVVVNFVFRC